MSLLTKNISLHIDNMRRYREGNNVDIFCSRLISPCPLIVTFTVISGLELELNQSFPGTCVGGEQG